jgi:hypothetical protein
MSVIQHCLNNGFIVGGQIVSLNSRLPFTLGISSSTQRLSINRGHGAAGRIRHIELHSTMPMSCIPLPEKSSWRVVFNQLRPGIMLPFLPLPIIYWTGRLTSLSPVLEKPPTAQLLRNFPTFYGTYWIITLLTRPHHGSLFWATWVKFIPLHPVSLRSNFMSSSHLYLGLASRSFPFGIPYKHERHLPCPSYLDLKLNLGSAPVIPIAPFIVFIQPNAPSDRQ